MKIFKVFKRAIFIISPFLKPKLNYIALGDSTVEGIGASAPKFNYASQLAKLLEKDFRVKLVNLGKKSATSYDVIETQIPKVFAQNPNLITISVGPNDIRKLKRVSKFKQNFELILKLLSNTGAKIVINTIPDMSKLPAIPKLTRWAVKLRVQQFNKVIHDLSKNYEIHVCDLFGKSQQFENTKDYIGQDGFHLSDLGYNLWAQYFYSDIKPLLISAASSAGPDISEERHSAIG